MHFYRKSIKYLLILLVVFLLTFLYGFWSLRTQRSIAGTELGYFIESWIVIVLSFIAIVRAVISLHTHKHPRSR